MTNKQAHRVHSVSTPVHEAFSWAPDRLRSELANAIASVPQAHGDEPLGYKLDRREIDDAAGACFDLIASRPTPTAEKADVVEAVARAIQDEMFPGMGVSDIARRGARAAIAALQSRPAEPAGEEPVAWLYRRSGEVDLCFGEHWSEPYSKLMRDAGWTETPLYARPAPSNPDRLVEALRQIRNHASARLASDVETMTAVVERSVRSILDFADTALAAPGSVEHPTATDWRNRAERAEAECAGLRAERDEADRRAGSAERGAEHLREAAAARASWLAKAKADAGFSDGVSFDVVWAQALPLLLDKRSNKQPPAMDGMPILDNGLNSVIDGALEIARKYEPSLFGLRHNLERLQEWIELYLARAKAPTDPREAWDWLTNETSLDLSYHRPFYADDDDLAEEWRVRRCSGPINDREWEIVGRGLSPLLAIEDARTRMEPAAKGIGA